MAIDMALTGVEGQMMGWPSAPWLSVLAVLTAPQCMTWAHTLVETSAPRGPLGHCNAVFHLASKPNKCAVAQSLALTSSSDVTWEPFIRVEIEYEKGTKHFSLSLSPLSPLP